MTILAAPAARGAKPNSRLKRHHRDLLQRRLTLVTAAVFTLSTVLTLPLRVLAQEARKPAPSHAAPLFLPTPPKPRALPPPASLKENLKPLTPEQAARAYARIRKQHNTPALTLLDEVGRLTKPVRAVEVVAWKRELRHSHSTARIAKLHLWLGEWELAANQQPQRATAHFQQTQAKSAPSDVVHGIAAYDSAVSLFYAGAYRRAAEAFHKLADLKTALAGYSRRNCSLFFRHASACAGYHAERTALGIPEPPQLDPLCAASGLAISLRALGEKYDKASILPHIRYTGEGSNLGDILDAAQRLGFAAHVVSTDDKGLIALPKPLIAYVEHDHFISVLNADKAGVSYMCSDCGAWPGGSVHLSWKQWHKLEATHYVHISRPGSVEDKALAQIPTPQQVAEGKGRSWVGIRLVSVDLSRLPGSRVWQAAALASRLASHVVLQTGNNPNLRDQVTCGAKWDALHCSGWICCLIDAPWPHRNWGQGSGPILARSEHKALPVTTEPQLKMPLLLEQDKHTLLASIADVHAGAQAGDPVNLATGEEEYKPAPDLSVYNPIGPSVVWSRMYNSLRGPNAAYQSDDFGIGWSQPYNVYVYDTGFRLNDLVAQGGSCTVGNNAGTDAKGAGLTWDIVRNGATVATSATPNGWTATLPTSFGVRWATVAAPASATIANNYEVRYTYTYYSGTTNTSSFFDVVAPTSSLRVFQGVSTSATPNGSNAPAASQNWDIVQGSTVVANATNPNGWTVSLPAPGSTVTVKAPDLAPLGSYEVRGKVPYPPANKSLTFTLVAQRFTPLPGTKYLYFPNGSRVAFTASTVPSSSQPAVACSVPTGTPLRVEWDYDANFPSGYYTVTLPDRSKWITTAGEGDSVNGLHYPLGQMQNGLGKALLFSYGSRGDSSFPVLTQISDTNGSALLTFARNSHGNLTSVSDRYGRSVYYSVSTYATQNVPLGWTQAYQEVDHVSQIVATGMSNPPDRYVYGYQNVSNGEGSETVPFLHTITVPSPTGTGNATATINYDPSTQCVSSLVDANGNQRVYTYTDYNHTKVTVKDGANNVAFSYTGGFDSNMNGTTTTDGAGTILSTPTYASANDPYRPSSVTDANNKTTSLTWDQYGNLLSATSPRNTTTAYTYSYTNFAIGELTSVQEGTKGVTTFAYYQPSGLVQSVTSPRPGMTGGSQTVTSSYTYDNLGNVLTETVPGNNASATITTTLNYTLDGNYNQMACIGQPLTVTDNLGKTTHLRYDLQGRLLSTTDALGNRTDYNYNIANQLLSVTAPATGQSGVGRASVVRGYLYPAGPLKSATTYDEGGNPVYGSSFTYGPEGECLARVSGSNPVSFTYDARYRLKTLADGKNNVTSYSYNAAGYRSQTVYPNGDTVRYISYDPHGNLLQEITGNGVTINHVYSDPESRLTDVQYPAMPSMNRHYNYDAYGRLSSKSDGTASISYAYDDNNAQTGTTTNYGSVGTFTVSASFYPNGSAQAISTPAGSFSYAYDADGRPSTLTNPFGETFSWTFLDNGWLATQQSASTMKNFYSYNALGELTELANKKLDANQTLLSDFSNMAYDGAGNRKLMQVNIPGASAFSGQTAYTYDSRMQLTQEQSSRNGGYVNNFSYDAAGNPTTFKGVASSFNAANQNVANTYDSSGNPTLYKGTTLTYDVRNRLTTVGSVLSAGYDPDGRRAWKQNANGKTYFVYVGDVPVCEINGSNGSIAAVNTFGINGLLSRHTSNGSSFYCFDPQGNVTQRLDAGGNILSAMMSDSFGTTATFGSVSDPYGYGGQWGYYTDSETGLQLLGHRYYDASAGRFLTRDPIGSYGGTNLYAYAGNSVPNAWDPTGYKAWGVTVGRWPALGGYIHAYIKLDQPCDIDPPGIDGCWSYGFWTQGADGSLATANGSSGSIGAGSGSSSSGSSSSSSGSSSLSPLPIIAGGGSSVVGSSSCASGSSGLGGSASGVGGIGIPGQIRNPDPHGDESGPYIDMELIDGSDDPSFMSALCKCINNSRDDPPVYSINMVCGSWVQRMIDCAGANAR